jgi:hypothetical protein
MKKPLQKLTAIIIPIAVFFGAYFGKGVYDGMQIGYPLSSFNYSQSKSIKQINLKGTNQKFQKKYAIIATGDDEMKFDEQMKKAFQVLNAKGFEINAFAPDSTEFSFKTSPSDPLSVMKELPKISKIATTKDVLFFAHFGHGIKMANSDWNIQLKDDSFLDSSQLLKWTSQIQSKKIFFFNSCFSGGFAKTLGKNDIAISSTLPLKSSYSFSFDENNFGTYFFEGLEKYSNIGTAFDYATEMDAHGKENSSLLNKILGMQNTPMMISEQMNPYSIQF